MQLLLRLRPWGLYTVHLLMVVLCRYHRVTRHRSLSSDNVVPPRRPGVR